MYTRKFIILRKDLGTSTGRNPKGHGKLEIKGPRGFVSVTIENASEQDIYNVVFISRDKSIPILNLGKIFTDDVGRGKGEYSFMQKDVLIESIKGILVMKDREVLLGGYLDKEDGTIERYIETISETQGIEEARSSLEDFLIDPEEDIRSEQEIVYEEVFEEVCEEDSFEEDAEIEQKHVEVEAEIEEEHFEIEVEEEIVEEVVVQEAEMCNDEAQDIINQDIALEPIIDLEDEREIDEEEPDYDTINHIKRLNQKNQTIDYVLSILRFFPYIDPFKYNIKGYNWWMVELDKENEHSSFLPYFSYLMGVNKKESYECDSVTCNQLMDKYQHYLFGLYNENEQVKYFVYGIPGEFIKSEHPNKGSNGFNTWYPGIKAEGYWIIYIDPMTGREVVPFNTMNPVD